MKGRRIAYSDAELAWIRDNCHRPRADAHADFVVMWNRAEVTLENFKALCTRRGWTTGRDGRFHLGQAAHNKGKPMPYHPNSAAHRFRPGERRGRASRLYKPIGTERLSHDGYLERKVNDDLPLNRRWRAVHLIRWEDRHGPVPPGHCLKCLDGDKLNTDPDNWAAIPRALLPRLNGRFGRDYDAAPPELRAAILATARLEHLARERRRKSGQKDG